MGLYKESGRQTSPVFVTVILAASVPLIFGLSLPITSDVEKSELIDVDIIEDTPQIRHKRDNSHLELPETTQIRLKINDDQVTLSLMRNAKLNLNTPVYVVRNGQVIQDLLPQVQGRALYHDIRNGASFLLTRHYEGANRGNLSLFGTFQAHSRHYVIQPNDDFDTTGSEEKRHTLSSMAPQTLYFDGILPKTATWKLNATRMHTRSRTKRQTKQYAIEVFAVIDYAVYDFFYTRASKSTTTAKQNIREYYTFVLNAMDARYKTISKEDFVMDILSAGIFIAEYPSAAPWTENHKSFGSPVYRVDSNSTLDAFTAWVDNQPNLPKRDHTMGFTAYNITSDKGQRDSAGIAFQGGITRTGGITVALCSDKSTSVIEESFNFISATTAAHELGHSLGSGHDDIQVNACSANDNYIMATSNEVTNTGTKGQNNWYFSSCSVSSFKSYIDYLDGFDINCMLTESDTSSFPTTDRPMAEAYPADKVCSLSLGVGSYVCRSIQDFNTLCASMFCNKPNTTQCYTVIPAEGTPCGKGKWCDKGACVTSSRAPIDVTDDCPLGNRPGVFDNTGKTCEQHIADDPGHCYGKYTLANCCASCQANKRNVKDCEYGDKFIGCEASNCDRYDSKSKAGCCETCADSSQTLAPVTTTSTQAPTTTPTTTKRKTQTTKSSTERFTPSRTTSQLTDPTTTSVMEVTTENTGTLPAQNVTTVFPTLEQNTTTHIQSKTTTNVTVYTPEITIEPTSSTKESTPTILTTTKPVTTTTKQTPTHTTKPAATKPVTTTTKQTPTHTTKPAATKPVTTMTKQTTKHTTKFTANSVSRTKHTTKLATTESVTTTKITTKTSTTKPTTETKTKPTTIKPVTKTTITETATTINHTPISKKTTRTAQQVTNTSKLTTPTTRVTDIFLTTNSATNITAELPQPKTSVSAVTTITTAHAIPPSSHRTTVIPSTSSKVLEPSGTEPTTNGEKMKPSDEPLSGGTSNLLIVGLGAGVGSLVVVVIVVVICVVLRKKRSAASQGASKPSKNNPYDNIGFVTNDRPNHPPPRRGSNSSFQPHSAIHTSNAPQISIVANGTRESVDGYMLPASVKLQEINNGVHYTAPNKPNPNGARNLPLQTFHNGNNIADQHKRISKPIHYKKTGMPVNGNTNKTAANANDITSHASGNGPPPYPQRKVSDAYDSIGDLQSVSNTNYNKDRRPTLPENHPRSLLRGDLRLGQPNAISMNTTNNNSVSKPSNNFQQYGQRHVAMVPPNRNKFNPQENTSDKINHQTPMEAPTPRPRNRLPSNNEVQKRADNLRVHNDDVVNTYDSADSTVKETNNRFPMKPPVKPVPRRQELSSIGSDSRYHQETTQLDNAQQNANTHADVNEENTLREPYKKLPMKPPTKPVPRRQNMFTESGKSNDAFRVDELEIQI